MWWEPTSENEREIANWLNPASEMFMSQGKEPAVWGIGTFITPYGLRPLLLFNERLLDAPTIIPRLISYQQLHSGLRDTFSMWRCPKSTLFLATTEPDSLSTSTPVQVSTGDILQCSQSKEKGTVGPSVEIIDSHGDRFDGILTAGHVTPRGRNSAIEVLMQRRWMPTHTADIGTVELHEDPAIRGTAGYDVSVIRLNSNVIQNRFGYAGIAKIGPLSVPRLCTMYAGFSGTISHSAIVGALMMFGSGQRQWINSWLLVPSSIAQRGDSGSLVCTSDTSEGVGILVGGSRAVNSPMYLCWYAQDLHSIQSHVLSKKNIRII